MALKGDLWVMDSIDFGKQRVGSSRASGRDSERKRSCSVPTDLIEDGQRVGAVETRIAGRDR